MIGRSLPLLLLLMLFSPAAWSAPFDFADYHQLLESYLEPEQQINGIPANTIDYRRWHADQNRSDSPYRRLLDDLAAFDPDTLENRNAAMAFWINVYNIAAIKTILDHYPVDSIRSRSIDWLGQPWKREAIVVGGRPYSLFEIEFDILVERYQDLRIHLGINCASVSCADLRPEPYTPGGIDRQLGEQGERLAAQPEKGLRIDREERTVYLSRIFKFDKQHFDAWAGGGVSFLLPYVTAPEVKLFLQDEDYRVDYLDYDWSLNQSVP